MAGNGASDGYKSTIQLLGADSTPWQRQAWTKNGRTDVIQTCRVGEPSLPLRATPGMLSQRAKDVIIIVRPLNDRLLPQLMTMMRCSDQEKKCYRKSGW